MKNVLGVGVMLLVAVWVNVTQAQPPEEEGPPQWRDFTSEDGGFAVEMPGEPMELTNDIEGSAGSVEMNIAVAELEGASGVIFLAAYGDYPEAEDFDAAAELAIARQDFLEEGNSTVDEETALDVEGGVGTEIEATSADGMRAHVRIYVVGGRIYVVGVNSFTGEMPEDAVSRFLDSFQFQPVGIAP